MGGLTCRAWVLVLLFLSGVLVADLVLAQTQSPTMNPPPACFQFKHAPACKANECRWMASRRKCMSKAVPCTENRCVGRPARLQVCKKGWFQEPEECRNGKVCLRWAWGNDVVSKCMAPDNEG